MHFDSRYPTHGQGELGDGGYQLLVEVSQVPAVLEEDVPVLSVGEAVLTQVSSSRKRCKPCSAAAPPPRSPSGGAEPW